MRELITYPGFDPYLIQDSFDARGWQTELVKVSNTELVATDPGAALECGDDRFDKYPLRKKYGPRVFGGVNAICALKTGGDRLGFLYASEELRRIGLTPGTHGGTHINCGLFELWRDGNLESAMHEFLLHLDFIEEFGNKTGEWIRSFMETLGGKHFTLPGEEHGAHEGLSWNPFIGMTEKTTEGDRVRNDDWLLAIIGGISLAKRIHFNFETVEKLHLPKKLVVYTL